MKLDRYELNAEKSLMVFEFVSMGKHGAITKLVKYSETNLKDVYNLAFGDKDLKSGKINDLSISDNGDRGTILATVVSTVYAFTDKYPDSYIYATGSTKVRTRLYRIGLTKYLRMIQNDFHLYGLRNDEWEEFEHEVDYDAVLVKRK